MQILQRFFAYAGEFEKTYADDDWQRVLPFFADDAVYDVKGPSFFGCHLEGPAAICAGIKKSLDGFDRKFSGRDISVTEGPTVEGDELRMSWSVTYNQAGLAPFVLRGSSIVRYRDAKIVYLCDQYDASIADEFEAWQQANGVKLDPSYT